MNTYILDDGFEFDFVKVKFETDFDAISFSINQEAVCYALRGGQYVKIYDPADCIE